MQTHSRCFLLAALAALSATGSACASKGSASARPAEATSASSTMNEGQVQSSQTARMEDLLARVPSLDVVRTLHGGYTLRIRGRRGVGRENSEPLLVVDGISIRVGGNEQALRCLNPEDIARVVVLKDAGSTAIYGSAGANGVVVITTRRGKNP